MPGPDFLLTEQRVEIPVGIGFAPTGFIARWIATAYYSFWSEIDFPREEYQWDKRRETSAGNYWYYFKDRAKAIAAYEETGGSYNPSPIWDWTAKSDTVLNYQGDDIQEVFGQTISRESAIRTLQSAKSRHELHMISLPSAVAAMATAYGYDNPGFPLDELLRPIDEILWTDDFQRDLIGNTDVGYTDSILWKRRAALWKALGEDDARMWQPKGAGTRWDTSSQKLSDCLAILHSPWKEAIWAQVYFVPDPKVDAIYQAGDVVRRLTRPALKRIFASKAEAEAAAAEELGAEAVAMPRKAAAISGEPTLPAGYEEFHDDWVQAVRELKEKHGDKFPPPPRLKEDLEYLSASIDDLKAWWDVV